MVVAREPKLVLLDEPSAGMTAEETRRTAELIREINRSATLIVVEHDMQFIRQIAHKVTVFHQGGILLEDSFERVVADPACATSISAAGPPLVVDARRPRTCTRATARSRCSRAI